MWNLFRHISNGLFFSYLGSSAEAILAGVQVRRDESDSYAYNTLDKIREASHVTTENSCSGRFF